MNTLKLNWQNYFRFELLEKRRFLFFVLSFIFVPSFLQILPSDTQPWYFFSITFLAFAYLKNPLELKFFFILIFLFILFLFIRQFIFANEQSTKSISYGFFLMMLPMMSKDMLLLFRKYFFSIILFHIIFAYILSGLSDGLYKVIYSARDVEILGLRSISFSYPEPSYTAKVLTLTALGLYLIEDRQGIKYKYYLIVAVSIFTLSLTGLILGTLAILSLLSFRNQLIAIFIGITILLLIYYDQIILPGRLALIQTAIKSLDINLIFLDASFVSRVESFEVILNEFRRFSFLGDALSNEAISFLSLVYLGWLGMFAIVFSALNFLLMLFRGKVFLFLVFIFCTYSDTFVYPATAIFIMGCFYNNLNFLQKLRRPL
ncbi:MAG: hypothetical protein ISP94_00435 [SAR86 cluster bacterium]|nr:hypothetical protein [SAR86 cluster bacterium]